jgi:hypothetical protein
MSAMVVESMGGDAEVSANVSPEMENLSAEL